MKTIKYMNHIFMRMYWLCLPVCGALIITEVAIFKSVLNKFNLSDASFEGISDKSNFDTYFAIAFAICLCIVPISLFRYYYGSKSIYMLKQTQPTENTLYYSLFLSQLMIQLTVWLAQLTSIFICFGMFLNRINANGRYVQDGIAESMIDLDFFRMFFPLGFVEWYRLLFILITSALAMIFITTTLLGRKYAKLIYAVFWGMVTISFLTNFRYGSQGDSFWSFAAFVYAFIISIYFYKDGKKAIQNNSIL